MKSNAAGSQIQAVHPLSQRFPLETAVQQSAGTPLYGIRTLRFQNPVRLPHTAAAGGSKRNHRLSREIITFQESVNNRRSGIPPDQEILQHGVVRVHTGKTACDGRKKVRISFHGTPAFLFVQSRSASVYGTSGAIS